LSIVNARAAHLNARRRGAARAPRGSSRAMPDPPDPHSPIAGHLTTRATHDTIHAGAPSADGCGGVTYQGATYRVRSLWNDPGHEARAVLA